MKTIIWENEIVSQKPADRGISDYHYLFSKGMSPEARKKHMIGDIWINWAVCLLCKDHIRSKNVHNMAYCKCGNIWVDWGSRYAKRNFKTPDSYIDFIETFTHIKK